MLPSVGLQVRASPKVLAIQKGEKLFPARCSQWYAVIHEMVFMDTIIRSSEQKVLLRMHVHNIPLLCLQPGILEILLGFSAEWCGIVPGR